MKWARLSALTVELGFALTVTHGAAGSHFVSNAATTTSRIPA
jgi:hypothetical protein